MKEQLFLRIGLHKCASTLLNHVFFSQHPELNHLGKPFPLDSPYREIIERIIGHRDYDAARCRELYEEHVAPVLGERVTTLSDGRIVGVSRNRLDVVPERLRETFGDCKILLTIRNQMDLVPALYAQYVGARGITPSIDEWIMEHWDGGIRLSQLLRYDQIVRRYADTFGQENLCILLLEDLREHTTLFSRQLCDFLTVDSAAADRLIQTKAMNPRMTRLQARLSRYPPLYHMARSASRLMPGPAFALASRILGHNEVYQPVIGEAWQKRILAVARDANQALAAAMPLPLAERGYPL